MKRSRTSPPAAMAGVSPALYAQASPRLEADYVALINGTATEDPGRVVARITAAAEVLGHLAQLGALTAAGAHEDDTAGTDAVLAAARAGMARENKS